MSKGLIVPTSFLGCNRTILGKYCHFQDDLRFFVYFDDGEVEYDADSAEEKNKVE